MLLTAAGCAESRPGISGYTLVEKGAYQATYAASGRAERLAYDGDGDGRVEAITFFAPSGQPARAEADTDGDGIVDRWELFDTGARLLRVGRALHGRARADVWEYADGKGGFSRREFDDDGDGRAERVEHIVDGRVVAEDLDADADGRCERRLIKDQAGQTIRLEIDADGDGNFEKQLAVVEQGAAASHPLEQPRSRREWRPSIARRPSSPVARAARCANRNSGS